MFSEALLALAMPSVSARAGGIILPLINSLCEAYGSNVKDVTKNKLGSWLTHMCLQTLVISSTMFLTGMAMNPLCATLAHGPIERGIGWTDWAVVVAVPGVVSLVMVSLILYVMYLPVVKSSPNAPRVAREKLEMMGPMTRKEKIMAATLLLTVSNFIASVFSNFHACISILDFFFIFYFW